MSITFSATATPTDVDLSAQPVLRAHSLCCRRGDRVLFSELSFELHPGQLLWLKGPNGRGKTSLLRLLALLAKPESGELLWGDRPCDDAPAYAHQRVYVGHHNALKDDLTVTESLSFLALIHGRRSDEASLAAALREWGMHAQRNALVRTLSQGQRRRVALARLLLEDEAGTWLLDEPYDALDAAACTLLDDTLLGHVRRGGRVMLTCHQPMNLAAAVLDLGGG